MQFGMCEHRVFTSRYLLFPQNKYCNFFWNSYVTKESRCFKNLKSELTVWYCTANLTHLPSFLSFLFSNFSPCLNSTVTDKLSILITWDTNKDLTFETNHHAELQTFFWIRNWVTQRAKEECHLVVTEFRYNHDLCICKFTYCNLELLLSCQSYITNVVRHYIQSCQITLQKVKFLL